FLLIRGYAANGKRFADETLDYLCELPQRLSYGYSGSGPTHGASQELIEAVTPFCSDERLDRLDAVLLAYCPEWERTSGNLSRRGHTQFALLLAIDTSRR